MAKLYPLLRFVKILKSFGRSPVSFTLGSQPELLITIGYSREEKWTLFPAFLAVLTLN
jgi:hypothetical protein